MSTEMLRESYLCAAINLPFHQLGSARTVFVFPQNFDTNISKNQKNTPTFTQDKVQGKVHCLRAHSKKRLKLTLLTSMSIALMLS